MSTKAVTEPPRRITCGEWWLFAVSLAERKGLKLPRGLKGDGRICRAFLDEHVERRPEQTAPPAEGGARPPSPATVRYAQQLAQRLGVSCPAAVNEDFEACRRPLDAHAGGGPQRRAAEPGAKARAGRRPIVRRTATKPRSTGRSHADVGPT